MTDYYALGLISAILAVAYRDSPPARLTLTISAVIIVLVGAFHA